MNSRGFGLIEIMIYIGVMSVVIGVALQTISDQSVQQSKLRTIALTRKSFSGAEAVLINQRQCRCNFLGLTFSTDISRDSRIERSQIKTFSDDYNCANSASDKVLSTTGASEDRASRADDIFLTNFQPIIRGLLYRAQVYIVQSAGGSVSFPMVLSTTPNGGDVRVDICGVDRGS